MIALTGAARMDEEAQAAHKGAMSRAFSILGATLLSALALTGCSGDDELPAGRTRVDCRPVGGAPFDGACTVERMKSDDGTVLVLRSPDGGFRRLLIVGDGRGVVAADGAEPVAVAPAGAAHIVATIGGMQYRLPARVTR